VQGDSWNVVGGSGQSSWASALSQIVIGFVTISSIKWIWGSDMFGGCVAILLAVGVVLSAVGAAIAFATSKAEDPRLQLLGSLLRLAADEPTGSQHQQAT
jgi:hypothetical protein